MPDDLPKDVASVKLISGWLRSDSCVCTFPRVVYKKGIAITTVLKLDDLASVLEGAFENAASESKFALVILPIIESADQLAESLANLLLEPRWSCREIDGGEEFFSFGLFWETASGILSNAVGMGPFGFMPVTRRAPLTCLGLWPKEHGNRSRKRPGPEVGIADTAHELNHENYTSTRKTTMANTKQVVEAFKLPATLTQITFRLPRSYRESFLQNLKPRPPQE